MEYKITTMTHINKNIMNDPITHEHYLEGEFKKVYHALYEWLRNQYCATVSIVHDEDIICNMYIGSLGNICVYANNKLLEVRPKILIRI